VTSHATAVEALTRRVVDKPQLIVVVGLAFEGRIAAGTHTHGSAVGMDATWQL